MKNTTQISKGYLICITGTVLWSSTAIFIRYLTETYQLPALVLAFWRDLTLTVTLGLFFLLFQRRLLRLPKGQGRFLLLYGLVLSLFNSLWTISVALNGAAVSTVLAYSSAGFTAVLGWRLFGEKLGRLKIFAVSLSLLGCVFVSGAYDPAAWQLNPVGVITGLLSGLAFAAYSLMGKEASHRAINPWTVLLFAFGSATLLLFGYNLLTPWLPQGVASTNYFWLGDAFTGWLVLFVLAIGPTVGGYGLYTVSLNYLPASVANVIATLEPVMTGVQAWFLLGERFTLPQWLGSGLIVGGVIVLRINEGREARRSAAITPPQTSEMTADRRIRYQGAILRGERILLLRHAEHNRGRDYWIIPGGGREPGESEEECVVREMKEETNLDVQVERLLLEEQRATRFGPLHTRTYLCRELGGELKPGYEPEAYAAAIYSIAEVAWFDLRCEETWGEKIVNDEITYHLMQNLRRLLISVQPQSSTERQRQA
ncbi:MAG: EamA family transporter [Chloroflexota bacterium]